MKSPIIAYHFTADTLRDGSPIPANGEWLTVSTPISICHHGLHASLHPSDALSHAPGPILHLVQLAGDIQQQSDKLCASRRMIGARFDATELLRADARASARSCLHLWSPPAIVVQWLETGDEAIRNAAWSAADSAAWSAAKSAAYIAAQSAAWSAAWSAARRLLKAAVDAKFLELGVRPEDLPTAS